MADAGRGLPQRTGGRRGKGRKRSGAPSSRGPPPGFGAKSNPVSAPAAAAGPKASELANVESIDADNVCFVCCEECMYYSVGKCKHPVCHVCSMRMRAICEDRNCPICREPLDTVLFTDDAHGPWPQNHKQFPGIKEWGVHCVTPQIQAAALKLFEFRCQECNAGPFKARELLAAHISKAHKKMMCGICFDNMKKFPFEHKYFTRQQLQVHKSRGDPETGLQRGHPPCRFGSCNRRFFDNDALYAHLREAHEVCTLCERLGRNHQFFENYAELAHHYEQDHFICRDPQCIQQHHIAFATEVELKAHIATVHMKDAKRSEAKQARRLDVNLVFGVDGEEGSSRSGRGGRGGRRGRDRGAGRGRGRGGDANGDGGGDDGGGRGGGGGGGGGPPRGRPRGGARGRGARGGARANSRGAEPPPDTSEPAFPLDEPQTASTTSAAEAAATAAAAAAVEEPQPAPPVVSAFDFPSLSEPDPASTWPAPSPQGPQARAQPASRPPAAKPVEDFPSLGTAARSKGKKKKGKQQRGPGAGGSRFSAAVGGPHVVASSSAWTPAPNTRNYAATTTHGPAAFAAPAAATGMFNAAYAAPPAAVTAQYIQPPDFKARNGQLAKTIKELIGPGGFETFKNTSAAFRKDNLPANEYLEACRTLFKSNLDVVFPEILALLPDLGRQNQLAGAFQVALDRECKGSVKSLNLSTKGTGPKLTMTRRAGSGGPTAALASVSGLWVQCSTCGQIVRPADVSAHNLNHHTQAQSSSYPSLAQQASSGGGGGAFPGLPARAGRGRGRVRSAKKKAAPGAWGV